MRVAILDDESAELDRVEQTLQQIPAQGEQAWTVHRFARGEDLLKQLKRETFDLLIPRLAVAGPQRPALLCAGAASIWMRRRRRSC